MKPCMLKGIPTLTVEVGLNKVDIPHVALCHVRVNRLKPCFPVLEERFPSGEGRCVAINGTDY